MNFSYVPSTEASIIAKQDFDGKDYTFQQWKPEGENETLSLFKTENLTKEQLLDKHDNDNASNRITGRVFGWLLMNFGTYLISSPLVALISHVPLFGYFFSESLSLFFIFISFFISAYFTLITIILANYHKPLLIAAIPIVFIILLHFNK